MRNLLLLLTLALACFGQSTQHGGTLTGTAYAGLATPSNPNVTTVGTSGTTEYDYIVIAVNGFGYSAPSAVAKVTTGNATLSGTNYNSITWTAVPGALGYMVYNTVGSPYARGNLTCSAPNTCASGLITGTSFADQDPNNGDYWGSLGFNTSGGFDIASGLRVPYMTIGGPQQGTTGPRTKQIPQAVAVLNGPMFVDNQTADPGGFPAGVTLNVVPPASQPVVSNATAAIGINTTVKTDNLSGDFSGLYGLDTTIWKNDSHTVTDLGFSLYASAFFENGNCGVGARCGAVFAVPEIDAGSADSFSLFEGVNYLYAPVTNGYGVKVSEVPATQPTNYYGVFVDSVVATGTAEAIHTNSGLVHFGDKVKIESGGSPNKAICWKSDGKSLGYCSTQPDSTGACTCN